MARSIAAHKLYAATDAGLKDAVNRVDEAVKRLTDRMDNYFAEGGPHAVGLVGSPPIGGLIGGVFAARVIEASTGRIAGWLMLRARGRRRN